MDLKAKLRPFYVAKMLYEQTDEEHYLTIAQIMERLEKDYGISTSRGTVGDDIKALQELGVEIKPTPLSTQGKMNLKEIKLMTKNTYNPYEIMMDKYDKEEMLSDVRESMLYQLGADVSCEELDHFFTGKGKAALPGCAEWQQCFAVEKMLEFYYMHARDETLAKQIETMTMLASRGNEHHG